MHPTIIAQRKGAAIDAISKNALRIAEHFNFSPESLEGLKANAKDPTVRDLYRLEAIAAFVARVAAEYEPQAGENPESHYVPADEVPAPEPEPIPAPVAEPEGLPAPVIEGEQPTEADAKPRRKKK